LKSVYYDARSEKHQIMLWIVLVVLYGPFLVATFL